ncbi:hypothetical protein BCR36DRAFT_582546 [Piromyces finnis]|uniref:Cellulase n=1 Tax=Piromyces finnis TaxID=1754191 RepID=A0A1Y1VCM2_9FUNG|nr:hypothetical protein BCR36DRAFT_582546 [Piromyces finnis]|eukprot:ORX52607.1 hypothetical protein BCR36DRAFT_582546 [Piromyces finnis]
MKSILLLSIATFIGTSAAAGYGPHGAPMCNGCTVTGTGGDKSLWGWENNAACEIDTGKCGGNNASNNNNNSNGTGPHGARLCSGCTVTGTGGDNSLWGWENNSACEIDTNKCGGGSNNNNNNNNNSNIPASKPVVSSGKKNGKTTRYWDCCKPSCSWNGKANVSHPVNTCSKSGSILSDINVRSGCDGGDAFMCTDQQPWAINSRLAYGFAAANISGSSESSWCCACYKLTFTSTSIAGKQMVVQVTNTGGDLGENHFDLQIPGGGLGIFDGCSFQFNTNAESWGQRYGGVGSVSGCSNLPASLQAGCKWRFEWFENADNPTMEFEEVECPRELTEKTGCVRR